MRVTDPALVLDMRQLREMTCEDDDLMREILDTLIDDTSRQIPLIESAIRDRDATECRRLAHYSKGACANVGANATAAVLEKMERYAASGSVTECGLQLAKLASEVERLRTAAK